MLLNQKKFMTAFAVMAAFLVSLAVFASPAAAATPAEQYVTDNVQKAMGILNNTASSKEQKKTEFQSFLLGLTDINAIARYTLGQYRRTASPEDITAYEAAFKDYALAVYQSYFAKYSGQSLKVTGSTPLSADETIVKSVTVDPKKATAKPFEVQFRVLNTGGKMVVVDFSVEGVWIRELERNDFTSYLGQHGGDVKQLTAMLKQKAAQTK